MASPVVGFTGSLESATPLGPNDGLFGFIFSTAHGVIGGVCAMNVEPRYRVAGVLRINQTPERSGGCCAWRTSGEMKTAANAANKTLAQLRICTPFQLFEVTGQRLPLQDDLCDANRVSSIFGRIARQ